VSPGLKCEPIGNKGLKVGPVQVPVMCTRTRSDVAVSLGITANDELADGSSVVFSVPAVAKLAAAPRRVNFAGHWTPADFDVAGHWTPTTPVPPTSAFHPDIVVTQGADTIAVDQFDITTTYNLNGSETKLSMNGRSYLFHAVFIGQTALNLILDGVDVKVWSLEDGYLVERHHSLLPVPPITDTRYKKVQ
jgi:hypothetical protein